MRISFLSWAWGFTNTHAHAHADSEGENLNDTVKCRGVDFIERKTEMWQTRPLKTQRMRMKEQTNETGHIRNFWHALLLCYAPFELRLVLLHSWAGRWEQGVGVGRVGFRIGECVEVRKGKITFEWALDPRTNSDQAAASLNYYYYYY